MNKIQNLEQKIKEANTAYYNGEEIISDDEYDALKYELSVLDPQNPVLSQIGAEPTEEWVKEKHLTVLGSLDKVNYPEELSSWVETLKADSQLESVPLLICEKLDGLSIGCQYKDGQLIKACLRGQGIEGENILQNVLKMKGVVKKLDTNFTGTLRGEIVLTKQDFAAHSSDKANPRNAASGISRRLDGAGSEHLTLMIYQVIGDDNFLTEEEQFNYLKSNKCLVPNYKVCNSADEVIQYWQQYQDSIRNQLDYEIDGLVCCINDLKFQRNLGYSNHNPKGKKAFKFAKQFVKTTINRIDIQVGNSGRITPVCWFDSVKLLGSEIKKASIYNAAYVNELQIDVGAEVLVCKAGEVIPRVEKVVKTTGTVYKMPEFCPECDTKLISQGEYIICPNSNSCPAQLFGRILNWVVGVNILKLGETLIQKLIDSELVHDISDLYALTIDDLSSIDRMAEKPATNVYNSIWERKNIPLEIFIGSLSIPLIGSSTVKLLVDQGYDTLEKLNSLTMDQLLNIEGLGEVKAQSLYNGLRDNKALIQKILDNGVNIKNINGGKLQGKSFCITGSLSKSREEFKQLILDNGGVFETRVGRNLNYLIIADPKSSSSKAVNARNLGIQLLSEQDFINLL